MSTLACSLNSATSDCLTTALDLSAYKAATFGMWLSIPTGASGIVLNLGSSYISTSGAFYVYLPGNGTIEFFFCDGGTGYIRHINIPSFNAWHRYLFQFDTTDRTAAGVEPVYIDKAPVAYNDPPLGGFMPQNFANADFGVGARADHAAYFVSCRVCDLTIWADPRSSGGPGPLLSQADATADYFHTINSVPSVQSSLLRHFWPLSGTGTTPEPDPVGNAPLSIFGSPQQIAGPTQPTSGPPRFLPEALGMSPLSGIR